MKWRFYSYDCVHGSVLLDYEEHRKIGRGGERERERNVHGDWWYVLTIVIFHLRKRLRLNI